MNKVEPVDIDNEYNDTDAVMSEPMNEKDECSDENGNFDDIDRDSADTKMHLANLNEIKTDINDNDEADDGNGPDRCLDSQDSNLLSHNGSSVNRHDCKICE